MVRDSKANSGRDVGAAAEGQGTVAVPGVKPIPPASPLLGIAGTQNVTAARALLAWAGSKVRENPGPPAQHEIRVRKLRCCETPSAEGKEFPWVVELRAPRGWRAIDGSYQHKCQAEEAFGRLTADQIRMSLERDAEEGRQEELRAANAGKAKRTAKAVGTRTAKAKSGGSKSK